MIGGGTGPADGTNATTCTPGPWNLARMLEAAEEYPMNLGFLGKGNCSDEAALEEQVKAGAMGLKSMRTGELLRRSSITVCGWRMPMMCRWQSIRIH